MLEVIDSIDGQPIPKTELEQQQYNQLNAILINKHSFNHEHMRT